MPSSQSVSRTVSGLARNRPALAIGAGAALASVIGVAAASSGPAVSLTGTNTAALARPAAVRPASHVVETVRGQQPARPAAPAGPRTATASEQVAQPAAGSPGSAGSQLAAAPSEQVAQPAACSAGSAGSQLAAAPSEQVAQPTGSVRSASSLIAAAPSEAQALRPAMRQHQAGLAAPAKPGSAPAQPVTAPSQPAPAASQPAAAPAAPQPAPQPYQIYDSVSPSSLPSSSQAVAVYANGNYAAQPSQVGQRGLTLWIDTNGSDTHADVLDVEPGDATPLQAASWVSQKLDGSPNSVAIVYTMRSEWPAVQAAVNALAWWMPSHTRYWIADPTGVPHVVPGSEATQWYWGQNFDISTALPNF